MAKNLSCDLRQQPQSLSSDRLSRGPSNYRSSSRYSTKGLSPTRTIPLRQREQRTRSTSRSSGTMKSTIMKGYTQYDQVCVIVVIGASTDTMKSKVYPSLWNLFKNKLLPKNVHIYAFSRSSMSKQDLREKCDNFMDVTHNEKLMYEDFWKMNNNYVGSYLARIDYDILHKDLSNSEASNVITNRLFFLAIPNTFLESVAQNIRTLPQPKTGWTRVMAEKPFGKDNNSSIKVTQQLLSLCTEDQLFRIDTCLYKEIVRNMLTIRFCNLLFSSTWNRRIIESVIITLKNVSRNHDKYGENGGIISDVVQLQGLQLLALTAMEKPISKNVEDIRDEKVKLLKNIAPVTMENVVLGQAVDQNLSETSRESKLSYYDDSANTRNGNVPTYCAMVVKINNERWDGVPFILECGNHMDEQKSEIRIRYQNAPADVFKTRERRNELVIQLEPEQRIFLTAVTNAEADNQDIEIPFETKGYLYEATSNTYDGILKDALAGMQANFVGSAEIKQAWRIFTPLLNKIDKENIPLVKYNFGTSGLPELDFLIEKCIKDDAPKTKR